MPSASDRLEFAPPPQPGMLRAVALAVLAHLLLLVALTFGLRWNRESQDLAAEAELWASVPQQAAPRELPPPPPPTPAPPVRQPVVRAEPKPTPPAPREADIALEREKKRQAEVKRREEEQARLERERRRKLEAQLAQRKLDEQKKLQAAQLAAETRKKEDEKKHRQHEKEEQDTRRVAQQREENLRRMQGMAGATGGATERGSGAQSSGPSSSWAGRIRARVRPNIVFGDDIAGNPTAEVEVRMAPDGTITGRRLVKSSGSHAWDEAVLRAVDKTEVLPRDVDGRIHSPVIIEFKPKG